MSGQKSRGSWRSQIGFIFAASGSAIGLGNIVFFGSNAYRFGGGAFYLPYLTALFVIGIPLMIMEFGLGSITGRSFPEAMHRLAGKSGQFVGWWALLNAAFIAMYYVTILAWVTGMMIGSFGELFATSAFSLPAFGLSSEQLPSRAHAFFFDMLSSWQTVAFVFIVWGLNIYLVRRGAETIERAVRVFVPLMWAFMIVLIIRGVTLPNGFHGILKLFTPDFDGISNFQVWQGAFSQMFFSLTLGFGVMTTYASYLPKEADQINNSLMVSFMNCGFEFIAGLAIFSLLFVFSLTPTASTLSMTFFVVPAGIAQLPALVQAFGFLFFLLLLLAGLSSSISLVEGFVSALLDKFRMNRARAVLYVSGACILGSLACALPKVIDAGLNSNGTLGLTLVDLIDHWAFSYGLIIVGLAECILIGWVFGVSKLREAINAHSKFRLGVWFDWLIKLVIPILILLPLVSNGFAELSGLYGSSYQLGEWSWLPVSVFSVWIIGTLTLAAVFTFKGHYLQG